VILFNLLGYLVLYILSYSAHFGVYLDVTVKSG